MTRLDGTDSFWDRSMMAQFRYALVCLLVFSATAHLAWGWEDAAAKSQSASRPNLLIILADDLGYSDLGCYGSEIATPNLDRLAANGLRYTSFYNTARCWPTRASLLTGYYPQQIHRDALPGIPGGGAPKFRRPAWAPLLPQLLSPAGYRCYYSGKWHIDGSPQAGGFHRSYELQDQGRFFRPNRHAEDGRQLSAVKDSDGYYSTIAIADHAVRCLKDHQQSHQAQPFFQYIAFTAPHFPLQALPDDIARYQDRYLEGWEKIREQRWEKQRSHNFANTGLSSVERTLGPPYPFPEQVKQYGPGEVTVPGLWTELTDEQHRFQATKMAIHAAMVDRMDQEIGRVVHQLKEMKALENTVILFLSDNGASAEMMVRDDGHDASAPMGSAATHLCLGPGWSTVSNTPFRRHKTWVHEGGISTPLIVHWPAGIKARGELRAAPGHVIDIVPTMLQAAGGDAVQSKNGIGIPVLPGESLLPTFEADAIEARSALWWLHEGNRALRSGDFKIVATKDAPWELYDLSTDRSEEKNLAGAQPERLRQLVAEWDRLTSEFSELAKANPIPAE